MSGKGTAILVGLILLLALFWKKFFPGTSAGTVSSAFDNAPVPASAKGAMAAATTPIRANPFEAYNPPSMSAPTVEGGAAYIAATTPVANSSQPPDIATAMATAQYPFAVATPDGSGLSAADQQAISDASYNGSIMPVYS
jgi:hypothetical protein